MARPSGFRGILLGVLAALLAPVLGLPEFYVHILILMMIFAVFAMSLDILMGYTGLPSLGHSAFFGLGAYAVGILTVKFGEPWWMGAIAGLLTSIGAGALFGLIALRTAGMYFLLITLALGQILWGAVNRWGTFTGGFNGLPHIPRPGALFSSTVNFYYLALALFIVLSVAMQRIIDSPFGCTLKALKDSESRMQVIGYNVWLHKYIAFVTTAGFAGCAGIINALYNGFVSPHDFSIAMSAEGILMVILGGTGTLWGPAVGAVVIVALRNFLSIYFAYWLLILGAFLIIAVLYAPNGVAGWFCDRRLRTRNREQARDSALMKDVSQPIESNALGLGRGSRSAMNTPATLQIDNVTKTFGGMVAIRNASFVVNKGERVALLGPNGAGKTTLFNIITGTMNESAGTVTFFGKPITRLKTYRRARAGIGRTFQITNLFSHLTVMEHIQLCAISKYDMRFIMHRHVAHIRQIEAFSVRTLQRGKLSHLRDVEVHKLSYGHQRQLEVLMTVSMEPMLLLLDEPTAGLAGTEVGEIIETIKKLDRSITTLIIEHDMDVAFAVADRFLVLNHGELIASGRPDEIRANDEVRRIYLGRRQA